MKRKVFINSGYSMQNGITLCSERSGLYYTVKVDGNNMEKIVGNNERVETSDDVTKKIISAIIMVCTLITIIASDGLVNILINLLRLYTLGMVVSTILIITETTIKSIQKFRFHAAEHMVVNAFNTLGRVPTIKEIVKYPRIHENCGTNLMVIVDIACLAVFACTFVHSIIWVLGIVAVTLVILIILRWSGVINYCQYITTRKPSVVELNVAIETAKFLEECEEENYQKLIQSMMIAWGIDDQKIVERILESTEI